MGFRVEGFQHNLALAGGRFGLWELCSWIPLGESEGLWVIMTRSLLISAPHIIPLHIRVTMYNEGIGVVCDEGRGFYRLDVAMCLGCLFASSRNWD